MYKKGFTLSEVLITLGVIGVVAAMTIPTIIENHQKQVVTSRMKKFYSTFNQALQMSVNEHGDMKTWTYPTDFYDYTGSNVFWDTYLKQHIKYTKIKQNHYTPWPTIGVLIYQPDGSSFCLSGTWVTFYPVADKKKFNTTRDVFLFEIVQNKNELLPYGYYASDNNLIQAKASGCRKDNLSNQRRACAEIIRRSGWKITDDYPW